MVCTPQEEYKSKTTSYRSSQVFSDHTVDGEIRKLCAILEHYTENSQIWCRIGTLMDPKQTIEVKGHRYNKVQALVKSIKLNKDHPVPYFELGCTTSPLLQLLGVTKCDLLVVCLKKLQDQHTANAGNVGVSVLSLGLVWYKVGCALGIDDVVQYDGVTVNKVEAFIQCIESNEVHLGEAYYELVMCWDDRPGRKSVTINKVEFSVKELFVECLKHLNYQSDNLSEIYLQLAKRMIEDTQDSEEEERVKLAPMNVNGTEYTPLTLLEQCLNDNPLNYEAEQLLASLYRALAATITLKQTVMVNGTEFTKPKLLVKCLQLDPENADAYFDLGVLLLPNQTATFCGTQFTRPQLFIRCIELGRDDARAYCCIAAGMATDKTVTIRGTEFTRQHLYIRCIELDENIAEAYNSLGLMLDSHQQPPQTVTIHGIEFTAQHLLIKCIELAPNLAPPYNNLAAKMTDEIVTICGTDFTKQHLYIRCIELDQNCAVAYDNLGLTMRPDRTVTILATKFTKQELFIKSIELAPHRASAYCHLAHTYVRPNQALTLLGTAFTKQQLFIRCIELAPHDPEAYFRLANLLQPDETVTICGTAVTQCQLYVKCIELAPRVAPVYHRLGETLTQNQTVTILGTQLTKPDLYVRCLELDRHYTPAYHSLANTDIIHDSACMHPSFTLADLAEFHKKTIKD